MPTPGTFLTGRHLHGGWEWDGWNFLLRRSHLSSCILWDGSLHGVPNPTFWVQDSSDCTVSRSHTCSILSHTWSTYTMVSGEYWRLPRTFCSGFFIPLCLSPCTWLLCVGLICYIRLDAVSGSTLKGGRHQSRLISALCVHIPPNLASVPLILPFPRALGPGGESTVGLLPSSKHLCSFFSPTPQNCDLFLIWKNFPWLVIVFFYNYFLWHKLLV